MDESKVDRFFVYILELKHGKYYVGRTHDLLRRMDEHRGMGNYKGAEYTKTHPVKKLARVIEVEGETAYFQEDMYTKLYMSIYGVDNVRGGSYVFNEINPEQRRLLERELDTASLVCRKCGDKSHFTNQCTVTPFVVTEKAVSNKGNKWSAEEEKNLIQEYTSGMKVSEIAKLHGRTEYAITTRLIKVGALLPPTNK